MARLIQAPLEMYYELIKDEAIYIREFEKLSQSEEDPVGQWLKLAKARGETSESDGVLMTLLVELHRKVDALSAYVRNEVPKRIELESFSAIDAIGFEYIQIENEDFKPGSRYYARVSMPVFPKRDIPLFLKHKLQH